jgi:hypothetical protein
MATRDSNARSSVDRSAFKHATGCDDRDLGGIGLF